MNGMLYVYKSMLNKLQNEWRIPIIFMLLAAMLTAAFISRAVLSITVITFVLFSFFHRNYKKQIKDYISSPFLTGLSLLLLLPLISGLWSENTDQWSKIIRIKLPLLFIPLALAAPFGFTNIHWRRLHLVFLALAVITSLWCIAQYAADSKAINEAYLRAKTMTTPLENDHVRYSWMISIAILLSAWMCWQRRKEKDILFWILAGCATWLIIFLHLLAARTGLLSFYIMLAAAITWWIFSHRQRKYVIPALALLFILPVSAYLLMPSFRNKIAYFRYEYAYFKKAAYLPGSNDAMRIISIHAGWNVMNAHPLTGVGYGDIRDEVKKEYTRDYPEMIESDKILPSSEWLMYGSGCGWTGFVVFTYVMLLPFILKTNNKLGWWLLNATALLTFVVDIGLEVQYGVFLYVFIAGLGWKWLVTENK